MPLKNGHFTSKERLFVKAMAKTDDQEFAAYKAGYSQPSAAAAKLMQNPMIAEATREHARTFLRDKAPSIAVFGLATIGMDEKQPAGARVTALTQLGKLSGIGITEGEGEKDLHEMSGAELSAYHAKLQRQADAIAAAQAERAKPVLEGVATQDTPDPFA